MECDLEKTLIEREVIEKRVAEMGKALSSYYGEKNPIAICILKGSIIFFADLIREMNIPIEIDFLKASSYGSGTISSGKVKMSDELSIDVTNRHVLLVEDIVDSGNTLKTLSDFFKEKGAAEVKICTLLDKPERRVVDVKVDYVGFEIADEFVVGYGMDYAQKYRNIKYIGVLKMAEVVTSERSDTI